MWELLRTAGLGWSSYRSAGKYMVFVFAALLVFWFGIMQWNNKKQVLFIYGSIMTAACICPVTAAVLMLYQTRFYDYPWIWSLVPVTLLIGAGIVEIFQSHIKERKWGVKIACLIALPVMLFLAGRMGADVEETVSGQQKEVTGYLVSGIKEAAEGEAICLWAPEEILTYVRALDGEITLLYGRDMWDAHLGAYSYDTYTEEAINLYRYMCGLEQSGEFNPTVKDGNGVEMQMSGSQYLKLAADKGVTHVVLPRESTPETVRKAEEAAGAASQIIEGYYLLTFAQ